MEMRNGTLIGWTTLEADERVDVNNEYGEAKDINDIMDIIRDIRKDYGVESPPREILLAHLNDPDAHNFTVTITEDMVVNVLYAEHLKRFGLVQTIEQFTDMITFAKLYATRDDYEAGTPGKLMNLGLAKELIDEHNSDPNAHSGMYTDWFPGEPIYTVPKLCVHPGISSPITLEYSRPGTMLCHDALGNLIPFVADEVPVDYIEGQAMIPMFDDLANRISNSEDLAGAVMVSAVQFDAGSMALNSPRMNKNMLVFGADVSNGMHGINHPFNIFGGDKDNLSVYNYPLVPDTGIRIQFDDKYIDILDGKIVNAVEVQAHQWKVNIHEYPNGWTRNSISFEASVNLSDLQIYIYKKDEGVHYTGSGVKEMALFQLQDTQTDTVAPPIINGVSEVRESSLKLKFVPERWTTSYGGLHVKMFRMNDMVRDRDGQVLKVLDSSGGDIIDVSRVSGKFNITTTNVNGDTLTSIDSGQESVDSARLFSVVFGWTHGHQTYAFSGDKVGAFDYYGKCTHDPAITTPNSNPGDPAVDAPTPYEFDPRDGDPAYMIKQGYEIIVGGQSGSPLNGYIAHMAYYGEELTPAKGRFLSNTTS